MTQQDIETPEAPDDLPSYVEDVLLDHEDNSDVLLAIERHAAALREAAELRDGEQEAVFQAETGDGQVIDVYEGEGESIVSKKQQCGDDSCGCMNGGEKHGPYLWRVTHHDDRPDDWDWIGKQIEDGDVDPDAATA